MIHPTERLLCRPEATERLVGSTVFKTVEAVKAAWRVRFPSASAKPCYAGAPAAITALRGGMR